MTDQSTSLFWDNYISKTKAYRIKSSVARWYVCHAEANLGNMKVKPPEKPKLPRGPGYSIPEISVLNLHSAILSKCRVTMPNR